MPRQPLLGPVILFFLGSGIGLVASYDRSLSLPFTLSLWGGPLVYLLLVAWCQTPARVRAAAGMLVNVAAAGALLLILQYRYVNFEQKLVLATRIGQVTSAFFPHVLPIAMQQNMAAGFLEGTLPLALGLWWSNRSRWRHGWLACACLIGLGLFLTVSRGAWLALTVCASIAFLAWIAPRYPRLTRWGVIGSGLGLAVVMIILVTFTPLPEFPAFQSLMTRAQDRGNLYRNSLLLALDVPLTGIGPGDTFGMVYSKYRLLINWRYLTYAHNLPLCIWLAQGLPGLLGFGGMITTTARLMWQAGRQQRDPLWMGAALGSLALLLHGLTDAPAYNPDGWWVLLMAWAILGVTIASTRLLPIAQEPAPAIPTRRWWPRLRWTERLALTLFVLSGTILLGGRQGAAFAAVNLGMLAEMRADLAPDLDTATRTSQRASATAWYTLARHFVPAHPGATRRLGIQALNEMRLSTATHLLATAQRGMPADQATRKALGYAYLWSGQIQPAVNQFRQLDQIDEINEELGNWNQWWNQQQRPDLAAYASQAKQHLASHLAANQPSATER